MKYNGRKVDVKTCKDELLTTRQGVIQSALKVIYIVLGVVAAGCALFVLMIGAQYGFEHIGPYIGMMLAFFAGIFLIFFFPMYVLLKEQREIKGEILRRAKDQGNTTILEELRRKSRRSMAVIVSLIVVVSVIGCTAMLNGFKSSGGGSKTGKECRICEKVTDLVPGFDMCEDCYESFNDWQEDNNT